jgi:hypothetical protein
MTDETPGPEASAEDMPIEVSAKARPSQEAKLPYGGRNTSFGRTTLINLAKAPDHFIQKSGKNKGRHAVNPMHIKGLLQFIAVWDTPRDEKGKKRRFFRSNERVEYDMEMTPGTLSHCIKAMTQAGWLTRKFRGFNKPYEWILHWDVIWADARPAFVSKTEQRKALERMEAGDEQDVEDELEEREEDEQDGDGDDHVEGEQDEQSLAELIDGLADDLLAKCAIFKPAPDRLPRPAVIKLFTRLTKEHGFKTVQRAALGLDQDQLANLLNDGTRIPIAYLTRVMERAIEDVTAVGDKGGVADQRDTEESADENG